MARSFPASLWIFAIFHLAKTVWGVHSPSSVSSSSRILPTKASPSTLLSKSIVGGSTEVKPHPDEEASTLFGVTRENSNENDVIYVEKRDGSKQPLDGKKVSVSSFLSSLQYFDSFVPFALSTFVFHF